jgi:hypothetical protein
MTLDPLTDEQAKAIAHAASVADGGCNVCVGDVCDVLAEHWPDRDWRKLAGLEPDE